MDHTRQRETILFVAVIALFAGFIEASNHATAGAYFLIGTILGVGLQFTGRRVAVGARDRGRGRCGCTSWRALMNRVFIWRTNASLCAGLRRARHQCRRARHRFVPREPRSHTRIGRSAQDVIGAIDLETTNTEERSLYQCLIVALRCGEAISYFEGKNIAIGPSVARPARGREQLSSDGATAAVQPPRQRFATVFSVPRAYAGGSSRL